MTTHEFKSFTRQDARESVFHMEDAAETRIALYLTPADLGIWGWVAATASIHGEGAVQRCASELSLYLEQLFMELTEAEQACMVLEAQ